MTILNETLIDDLLGKLESVRSWSPRVISKLESLLRDDERVSERLQVYKISAG